MHVALCFVHYVNALKQKLIGTKAYLETDTDEMSLANAHLNDLPIMFSVLPTTFWLPKLHKRPYKARFIANSSFSTSIKHSRLLTFCLTAINSHVKILSDSVSNFKQKLVLLNKNFLRGAQLTEV